jgi:hypothetical protein
MAIKVGWIAEKSADELLRLALEHPHKSEKRMLLLWEVMERENPNLWQTLREVFHPKRERGRPKGNKPKGERDFFHYAIMHVISKDSG